MALSDRNVIINEVNGLKGKLFNELVTYREESVKKAETDAEGKHKTLVEGIVTEVGQRTNLSGGLRKTGGAELEVTDALRGYLAERTAAIGGDAEKPEDWLKRNDYGNSYKDYVKHQEKMTKEKT